MPFFRWTLLLLAADGAAGRCRVAAKPPSRGTFREGAGARECLSCLSPPVAREMVQECRVWASLVKPETAVVIDQLKKRDPKLQTLGTETVFELQGFPSALFFFTTPFPGPTPPPGKMRCKFLLANYCSIPFASHPHPLPSPISPPPPYLALSFWARDKEF